MTADVTDAASAGGLRRIAIVGIDGAGKTSLVRRFLALSDDDDVLALACPAYHETPEAPFGGLSRALEAFSAAADELGSYALKGVSMYLQMTLYGPVERFMSDAFRPRTLLCERHALVDTLAYGALYGQLIQAPADPALEEPLRDRMGDAAFEAVLAWVAREGRRLGETTSLWELPLRVAEVCRRPFEEQVPRLQRRYRVDLPEVVVLLDLPVDVAVARVAGRDGGEAAAKELHEQAGMLEALRKGYAGILTRLGAAGVETHTIDVRGEPADAALRAIL